jgi:hypothetical protein
LFDLGPRSTFKEKFQGFAQIVSGLLDGRALAGDVQLGTQGDEAIALSLNDCGKFPRHTDSWATLIAFRCNKPDYFLAIDKWRIDFDGNCAIEDPLDLLAVLIVVDTWRLAGQTRLDFFDGI